MTLTQYVYCHAMLILKPILKEIWECFKREENDDDMPKRISVPVIKYMYTESTVNQCSKQDLSACPNYVSSTYFLISLVVTKSHVCYQLGGAG